MPCPVSQTMLVGGFVGWLVATLLAWLVGGWLIGQFFSPYLPGDPRSSQMFGVAQPGSSCPWFARSSAGKKVGPVQLIHNMPHLRLRPRHSFNCQQAVQELSSLPKRPGKRAQFSMGNQLVIVDLSNRMCT